MDPIRPKPPVLLRGTAPWGRTPTCPASSRNLTRRAALPQRSAELEARGTRGFPEGEVEVWSRYGEVERSMTREVERFVER